MSNNSNAPRPPGSAYQPRNYGGWTPVPAQPSPAIPQVVIDAQKIVNDFNNGKFARGPPNTTSAATPVGAQRWGHGNNPYSALQQQPSPSLPPAGFPTNTNGRDTTASAQKRKGGIPNSRWQQPNHRQQQQPRRGQGGQFSQERNSVDYSKYGPQWSNAKREGTPAQFHDRKSRSRSPKETDLIDLVDELNIHLSEGGLNASHKATLEKWLDTATPESRTGKQCLAYWLKELGEINLPQLKLILCCVITVTSDLSHGACQGLICLHSEKLKDIVDGKADMLTEDELKTLVPVSMNDGINDRTGQRPPFQYSFLEANLAKSLSSASTRSSIGIEALRFGLETYTTEMYPSAAALTIVPKLRDIDEKAEMIRLLTGNGSFARFAAKATTSSPNVHLPKVPTRNLLQPSRDGDTKKRETQGPMNPDPKRTRHNVTDPVVAAPSDHSSTKQTNSGRDDAMPFPSEDRWLMSRSLANGGYSPYAKGNITTLTRILSKLYPGMKPEELSDVTSSPPLKVNIAAATPLSLHNSVMKSRNRLTQDDHGFGNSKNVSNTMTVQTLEISTSGKLPPPGELIRLIALVTTSETHALAFLDINGNPLATDYPADEENCASVDESGNTITIKVQSSMRFARVLQESQYAPRTAKLLRSMSLIIRVTTEDQVMHAPTVLLMGATSNESTDGTTEADVMTGALRKLLQENETVPSSLVVTSSTRGLNGNGEGELQIMEVSVDNDTLAEQTLLRMSMTDRPLNTTKFGKVTAVPADDPTKVETALRSQQEFEQQLYGVKLTRWPGDDPHKTVDSNGDTMAEVWMKGPTDGMGGPIAPIVRVHQPKDNSFELVLMTPNPVDVSRLLRHEWIPYAVNGGYGDGERFKGIKISLSGQLLPIGMMRELVNDGIVDDHSLAAAERLELQKQITAQADALAEKNAKISSLERELAESQAQSAEAASLHRELRARNDTIADLTKQITAQTEGPTASEHPPDKSTTKLAGVGQPVAANKATPFPSPPPGTESFLQAAYREADEIDAYAQAGGDNPDASQWTAAVEEFTESIGANLSQIEGNPNGVWDESYGLDPQEPAAELAPQRVPPLEFPVPHTPKDAPSPFLGNGDPKSSDEAGESGKVRLIGAIGGKSVANKRAANAAEKKNAANLHGSSEATVAEDARPNPPAPFDTPDCLETRNKKKTREENRAKMSDENATN